MTELLSSTFEFITPAFLCGADQSRAEVRPASVRGQLRWWFRVLGGTPDRESAVFGGVHGGTKSSAVVVRVSDVKAKHAEFQKPAPNSARMYLYYFALVSGTRQGIRIEKDAWFAPGTAFRLDVFLRSPVPDSDLALLRKAVQCFSRLGSLGLRATRGCGVFTDTRDVPTAADFDSWTKTLSDGLLVKTLPGGPCRTADDAQMHLGSFLQDFRRTTGLKSSRPSALGFSAFKKRESSALRLRPIQVREGFLPVVVYTDAACSQTSIADLL